MPPVHVMRERVFAEIMRCQREERRRPTFDEIAAKVGYRSKSSVCDRIDELVAAGRLDRNFYGPETFKTPPFGRAA